MTGASQVLSQQAAMVAMISLARQFELQMKVLSTADENDRQASKLLSLTG
jgi:flagellar basal-body rod protein FlgF